MRLMANLSIRGLGLQTELLNQGLSKIFFLFQLSRIHSNSAEYLVVLRWCTNNNLLR